MSSTGRIYGAASVSYHMRSAGSPALRGLEFELDAGAVGAGGSGSRYVVTRDGGSWIMKSHILGGQPHRYLCLNEALYAQLALRIGVNVPEPAVIELTPDQLEVLRPGASSTDRFFFGSALIADAEALSPTAAADADPAQLSGFTVLDALVINTDRKPEHVLARQRDDGGWDTWPIDHGHTLAISDTLTSFQVQAPAPPPIPLVADRIDYEDMEPWIEDLAGVDRTELLAMVDGLPASWVVEPDAAGTLADALLQRISQLPDLLRPHARD